MVLPTGHSRVSLDTSYIFSRRAMAAAPTVTTPLLHTASVVADFCAIDEGELSVKAGTTLMLLHAETDGWALVRTFRRKSRAAKLGGPNMAA